jgi:3-deoxy-manno-octulosonate cytidylyltransferase (CMP-KDO synthetase)
MMKIYKIVPFRLQSQRFPDKPLCSVFGKTLIENALDIAHAIGIGETILTAPETDYRHVSGKVPGLTDRFFTFAPTSENCKSATERVLELYTKLDGDLFISIPMDEPALIPAQIKKGIEFVKYDNCDLLTLYCDFYCKEDAFSRLSAKIVTNNHDEILYMSRAVVPLAKDGTIVVQKLKKNVGVFYFKRDFLDKLAALHQTDTGLDRFEGLEQLRWLELGFTIKVLKIKHYGFGIDVPEQVKQLEKRIECLPQHRK